MRKEALLGVKELLEYYIVVSHEDRDVFQHRVSEKIIEGYSLVGGVNLFQKQNGDLTYSQAMTLELEA